MAHSSEVVLYLAPDQNLPQSNFFLGLKIAVNENYDIHYCTVFIQSISCRCEDQ